MHFVDEKVDNGPVIIQAAVPVYPEDDGQSLGERILRLEHRVYPQAIAWLAAGRLSVAGRKVALEPAGMGLAQVDDVCLVNPPLEEGF